MLKLLLAVLLLASPIANSTTCRDPKVKHKFDLLNGYPKGRAGYIVDHVCALDCGGKDEVTNMQYQTLSASKLKDSWETTKSGCKITCNKTNSTPTRQIFNCK